MFRIATVLTVPSSLNFIRKDKSSLGTRSPMVVSRWIVTKMTTHNIPQLVLSLSNSYRSNRTNNSQTLRLSKSYYQDCKSGGNSWCCAWPTGRIRQQPCTCAQHVQEHVLYTNLRTGFSNAKSGFGDRLGSLEEFMRHSYSHCGWQGAQLSTKVNVKELIKADEITRAS